MQDTHPETQSERPAIVLMERARTRLIAQSNVLPLADRAEGARAYAMHLAITENYLLLHAFLLCGLALMGKGFAYLGVPPLFISEAVLALGLIVFLTQDGTRRIFASPQTWMIGALIAWGLARTIPFIKIYKFDALRDWMLLGYMTWAVVIGGLIVARPQRLVTTILRYRRFCMIFAVGLPIAWFLSSIGFASLFKLWGTVNIITLKVGDTLVHLGSVGAFIVIALVPTISGSAILYMPTALMLFALGNRAGQLAMMMSLGFAFLVRGFNNVILRYGIIGILLCATVFLVAGTEITIPGTERVVSIDKVVDKFVSVVADSGNSRFDNSKEWRISWWTDIIHYTVFGEYFWQGKGFGVNLADDDGYQVSEEGDLRSPHNSHLNVLARSGVPGFVLWCVLHFSWAWTIGRHLFAARKANQVSWSKLFALLLIFWSAYMLNASFDVVFEGPTAAVWFWTIFGVGMAAVWIHQHMPEILSDERSQRGFAVAQDTKPVVD